MEKKKLFFAMLMCLSQHLLLAQSITQTIRGKVIDTDAKYPLIGVTVLLADEGLEKLIGTTTDLDGFFRLTEVPLGRHNLKFSFIGYKDVVLSNLILTSQKELVLEVSMEEMAISLSDVVVRATRSQLFSLKINL